MILGFPFGTPDFVQNVLTAKVHDITSELPLLEKVTDGLLIYNDARIQTRLPLSEGGLGLTAATNITRSAFYNAMSVSLRWITELNNATLCALRDHPNFTSSQLMKEYDSARTFLLD